MPNKVKKKTLEGDEQKETSTRGSTARYNERRSSNLATTTTKKKLYLIIYSLQLIMNITPDDTRELHMITI